MESSWVAAVSIAVMEMVARERERAGGDWGEVERGS